MESQVDVLEGKRRALGRYRDAVAELRATVARTWLGPPAPAAEAGAARLADPDARCRPPCRGWS